MTELYYPLRSLREGNWFKLICGASFQHLPAVRNLTLAYTLAGADCIDVAADPAVIASALDALQVATEFGEEAQARGFGFSHRPLLMVSLNDGEDPHFRKAEFDPELCPADCPRPCETICPAQAIVFQTANHNITAGEQESKLTAGVSSSIPHDQSQMGSEKTHDGKPEPTSPPLNLPVSQDSEKPRTTQGFSGVIDQRCYGCGRCLPICPSQLIYTRSYVSAPEAIAPLILPSGVDALEIHTKVGHFTDFQRLWKAIAPWVNRLKLLAISCPDGDGLIDYLWELHELIMPLPCPLVWQTDGRPMSGDIGIGATRAAVKLSQKVLSARLPGYVQLAGGTNAHTVMKLRATGLLNEREIENGKDEKITQIQNPKFYVAGIAYGSYARVLLSPILEKLEQPNGEAVDANLESLPNPSLGYLEAFPSLLWQAVATAHSLVSQLKSPK
ncbi:LdpA C-terminal domain-containing domain [Allocoleopsis sp.]|uniref:Light dependent period protein LdpA domain-containing protein n=1 Tax=Allocoleopsis sp. TaxID=3088169 RepID=UPI002FCF8971